MNKKMPKPCVQKTRIKLYQGDVNISKKVIRIHNINTYEKDHKEYRGLILDNGIKVILISDDNLKSYACASLGLNMGSMMDPEDLPGLAHLVEHCLFDGTEKYPEPCGSNFQGYTKMDTTVYTFHCQPHKLNENLDKLSQFFLSPLFDYASIKSEIANVSKECGYYEKDDAWKIIRLASYLTRPHPYSKYSCGGRKIFEDIPRRLGINLRDEILKFYKKWYSANLMSLVVYGSDSLDELEKMVIPKYSKILNYKTEIPIWQKPLFHKEICTSKIYVVRKDEIKSLVLYFNIEDVNLCYKIKPALYLEYLLNRRGQGSLMYELRSRNLCISLRADALTFCRGNGLFVITIELTSNGLDNIDEILKFIFQYFNYIKEEGIQKWLFEQQSNLRKMDLLLQSLYMKVVPYTQEIIESLLVNPMEDVLTAPVLISNWCPDLIIKLLDGLEPKNCVIFIASKTFDNNPTVTYEKEPWFKIKYYKEKIPFDTLKKFEYARYSNNMFQLPSPIPFLPTNFDILPLDKNITKFPTVIHNSAVLKVWHKQATAIFEPRIFINLNILNPISNVDPLNCVFMSFLIFALDYEIFHMEDAHLVNMFIRINELYKGININIIGFSHKCEIFFKLFLDHIFNFKFDSTMFERVKYKYRMLMSDVTDIEHALNTLHVIITENQSSFMDNLLVMDEYATFEQFQQFRQDFFSRVFIEALICGNTNMQKSLEYVEILKEKLLETDSITVPLSQYQLTQRRDYKLTNGQCYRIKIDQTICVGPYVAIYIPCGLKTDKNTVITSILTDIFTRQIIFTNTLKDLGFELDCYTRTHNNTNGLILFATLTQPVKYRMSTIEKLIEDFLEKMQKKIVTLSSQELQAYKNYSMNFLTSNLDDTKVYSIFSSYCEDINNRGYYFEQTANEVAALIKLTRPDIVRFYKKYITKTSPARRTLIIHSDSKECYTDDMMSNNCVCDCRDECNQFEDSSQEMKTDAEGLETCIEIHDIAAFKASMELYPLK